MISVIIPTYNHGTFLPAAVNSILKQSYQDFELIIVDDGSTDNTKAYLDTLIDERIRVIHQPNMRLPAALNTGMRAAKGMYVTWVSADCYCANNFLEVLYNELHNDTRIGLVYSNFYIIDEFAKKTSKRVLNDYGITTFIHGFHGSASFMYKRECHDIVGYYDTELEGAEDFDMWVRIEEHYMCRHVPDFLYYYRQHENTMSHMMLPKVKISRIKAKENRAKRNDTQDTSMNLVLVTNQKFIISAVNLIEEYKKYSSNKKILFYHYGNMPEGFLEWLKKRYQKQIIIKQVEQVCNHAWDSGLYFYKVYAIHDAMFSTNEPFLYLDCGISILKPTTEIENELKKHTRMLVWLNEINEKWITKKCFEKMGLTGNKYYKALMFNAGIQAYLPNGTNKRFIDELYQNMLDIEIAGPSKGTRHPEPKNPICKAHRNDQSVLSILVQKYGFTEYCGDWNFLHKFAGWESPVMVKNQVLYVHRNKVRSIMLTEDTIKELEQWIG